MYIPRPELVELSHRIAKSLESKFEIIDTNSDDSAFIEDVQKTVFTQLEDHFLINEFTQIH